MKWIERLRGYGFDVDGICLSIDPPRARLGWKALNSRWKSRERRLVRLYNTIAERAHGYDAFINFTGLNLHPEFVSSLDLTTVFSCFDDPESSEDLSRPVAAAYDLALVGNIAEVPKYAEWGQPNAHWWPLGFRIDDYDSALTVDNILTRDRSVDVSLMCERESGWRAERLEKISHAFPNGEFYGRGWPRGVLAESDRVPLLQDTRIGLNIHNSTGPINFRTFYLPANGVMQICDNKHFLGQVFDVGKEAVGYETIDEAIELTQYYLKAEEERREIAAAGFERAVRDYSEEAVFRRAVEIIARNNVGDRQKENSDRAIQILQQPAPFKARLQGRLIEAVGAIQERVSQPVAQRPIVPYQENTEVGAINLAIKRRRERQGGPFEWPNILKLNRCVAQNVGDDVKNILEIGSGTGAFAYEVSQNPDVKVVAWECDAEASVWARENRQRCNIEYVSDPGWKNPGGFDLCVSIEVIEHVADFVSYLKTCRRSAPRTILTTPNKRRERSADNDGPPEYYQHVREWSAGEFYWVLRCYWGSVRLFTIGDQKASELVPISVTSTRTPLIAECSDPLAE